MKYFLKLESPFKGTMCWQLVQKRAHRQVDRSVRKSLIEEIRIPSRSFHILLAGNESNSPRSLHVPI